MTLAIRTLALVALAALTTPVAATEAQTVGSLPIYPGARPAPDRRSDGHRRGTLTLADVDVAGASAATFTTGAGADAVLAFYRRQLQRIGTVSECRTGANRDASVRLDEASLNDPAACRPSEFGEGDTELKARSGGELVVVTVRSIEDVCEFALVDVHARTTR